MSAKNSKKQLPRPVAANHDPGQPILADTTGSSDPQFINEEILRWILTICSSVLVYIIIAINVRLTYQPDIESLNAIAKKILLLPNLALPEPMEALLFRLGIVTIIPGLVVFYILFSRMPFTATLTQKRSFPVISILSVIATAAVIFISFAAHNESEAGKDRILPVDVDAITNNNFNFFFDGFFIGRYLWLYALIIVPAVSYLFFAGIKKYKWENKQIFRRIVSITGYGVSAAVVIAIVAMNTFKFPYGHDNKFDFNAVYYSVTQVFAGVPMLVDGFTNTYGLYPHFLNPLFRIIGLDVLKFSLVMSLVLGLAFFFNFYALKKFVSNTVLLFLGFTTLLFFSYLNRKLQNQFDCYYALFPIRYIVPSVLVFLATRHFLKPSKKSYWATTLLIATSVLWNPEIGLVCYLSWIVTNMYHDFYNADGKIAVKKLLAHLGVGITVLPVVFYSYKLLIFLFYGAAPDMWLLWSTMLVFGKIGFNLLPMALLHPWNIVALIIIAGFTYSVAKWHKKEITARSSVTLLLALIGVGYLMYFQGRSHSVNLSVSSGFSIMLLTILADDLWAIVKNRNILFLNAVFVLILFLCSFSIIELVYNSDKISKYVYQEDDKIIQAQEQEFVESNTGFLLQNTVEEERIQLLTVSKFQGLYFNGSKRRSAFNPGIVDMFLNSDLERFQNMIADSSYSIFIEPEIFSYAYMFRTIATITALYDMKAAGKSMVLLKKRKQRIPAKRFFGGEPQMVLHRKYADNKEGIDRRVSDAFGINAVTLAPAFSVEVLFYSQPQLYPYATLMGNFANSSGFMISNVTKSNYVFAINDVNNSIQLQVPANRWVYLVMNVFPDRLEVYQNGKLEATNPLSPMLQSTEKLYVGNMGNPHYYLGAIAEAAVINKALDSTQVRATWEEINRAIAGK